MMTTTATTTIMMTRMGKTYNIHITQMIVPELIHNQRGPLELPLRQSLVDVPSRCRKLVQDPPLRQRKWLRCYCAALHRHKVLVKLAQDVLGCLVDLVAELAITVDDLDVEVDIVTCACFP
jgi:hypothetical protein